MVATRSARRGVSTIGCLGSVVLTIIVLYYGINLGRVWWRYWEIKDRMQTAARYADDQTAAQIQAQLRAEAREIGLPEPGPRFHVIRLSQPPSIQISAEYEETVDLPLLRRTIRFAPQVSLRR